MAELVLSGVSRSFGGLMAVRDVSMRVSPGRITGLVGPNGAGKTTLVNLISGLLQLSSGSVAFDGQEIGTKEPHEVARAGIARTFQTCRLLNDATVAENVLIGFDRTLRASLLDRLFQSTAYRRDMAEGQRIVSRLLDEFKMTAMAEHLPTELSYGHQRRVEIMRALATAPRLLILDEPAAGLNDAEARDLSDSLRALASQGFGLLLIEHNMTMVMNLCDEIYVLNSGELIAHGTPEQVRADRTVVSAYLGESACS
jgi:branched-chain amino acid transport system ATP-binding protein